MRFPRRFLVTLLVAGGLTIVLGAVNQVAVGSLREWLDRRPVGRPSITESTRKTRARERERESITLAKTRGVLRGRTPSLDEA